MKKQSLLLSVLLLSAAVSASAQNTTFENTPAIFRDDSDVSVAKGMSRETVNFMLGVPSETLGDGVWVYFDFRGKGTPEAAKADTLVLVFSGDKVSSMRLCENKPMREYVAKLKAKTGLKTMAAK
jgi:outer membrane protein assembly factor BamE (lipoprotein component of BamABCDE complex)